MGTEALNRDTIDITTNIFGDHLALARFNRNRLNPRLPSAEWRADFEQDYRMHRLELTVLERERLKVRALAAAAPREKTAFMEWFKNLLLDGPGQNSALFPWLADHATREEMKWFIRQEVAGEAGFEDLTALTQIKFPVRPKLEMARNYWDEMGRGREPGMHGPMLERVAQEFELSECDLTEIVPESLALGNIMIGLALNRQYAYHSVGALGAIELTAPGRAVLVHRGLKRLGVASEAQRYYLLHSSLDIKHSQDWNREVIEPILDRNPEAAGAIAEGALMRLHAGARCFERYMKELNVRVH